jgi:hypothetical protein
MLSLIETGKRRPSLAYSLKDGMRPSDWVIA